MAVTHGGAPRSCGYLLSADLNSSYDNRSMSTAWFTVVENSDGIYP